jgi:hypothetical protein
LPVTLQYKIELGMFLFEARLDDSGVFLQRGAMSQALRWDQVYGAALLGNSPKPHGHSGQNPSHPASLDPRPDSRPDSPHDSSTDSQQKELSERAARVFGDSEMLAKMKAMQDRFETITFGYRDARGRRKTLDFPIPADDPRYLQEISSRLGSRWLGEVADHHQAEKKLGTAPGFFKLALVLIALLVAIALVAVFGFFTALGPAFHFLSLQRMLLDLQDGEYASFGTRLLGYLALFVLGFQIRRWWRARWAQRRATTARSRLGP